MKKHKNRFILLLAAFLILLSTSVYAIPNPSYDFYVYDEANILSTTTENYIIETNKELYNKTGAQVVWATINDLEGMDINTYATALFDEWDIGSKDLDNGLLVLIVPNNGELWIEVGYGLEGILPDGRTKRIIEENIIPYFSQGDYDAGVLSGYEEILNYIESEYNIELQTRDGNYYSRADQAQSLSTIPRIFLVIGVIIFLFIDFKFFGGWLTIHLIRGLGRGGYSGGGSGRSGSRGGGGR
ncbi:MAG: TPM domain-containing protein, partial [Tissierellia bacterium]|nr:TPM domain-containing protein [Tissierellia bacterium]